MTKKSFNITIFTALWIILSIIGTSCTKSSIGDEDTSSAGVSEVNKWIYEKMNYYYLWRTELPTLKNSQTSLDAEAYFYSLRYLPDKREGDRFSYIESSTSKSMSRAESEFGQTGYGIEIYRASILNDGTCTLVVEYVYPASPAALAGFKRGDLIFKVGGTAVTSTNLNQLRDKLVGGHTGNVAVQWGTIPTSGSIIYTKISNLTVAPYVASPVHEHKILQQGTKKIGYLCYLQFKQNTDVLLNDVFAEFKREGVTELILDLRNNPGGYTKIAAHLASLMIPQTYLGKEFMIFKTNGISTQNESTSKYEGAIAQNNLNLKRLYVLTNDKTASASESIIHCCRPFMTVYSIGETTVGKNQASIEVKGSEASGNFPWTMWPIFAYVHNYLDKGFDVTGLTPNYEIDFTYYNYTPLGDPADSYVAAALNHISTGSFPSSATTSSLAKSDNGAPQIVEMDIPDRGRAIYVPEK